MKTRITLLAVFAFVCSYQMVAQVPDYVPRHGLIGWWPLDGNAVEASLTGLSSQSRGAVPTTNRNGEKSKALAFDGNDDLIIVQNDPKLMLSQFSLHAWFKVSNYPKSWIADPACYIIGKGSDRDPNGGHYSIHYRADTRCARLSIESSNRIVLIDSHKQLDTARWYCITGTWNGRRLRLYIDGVLQADTLLASELNIGVNAEPLSFGQMYDRDLPYAHNGFIDDVGIWDRELTASEIQDLFYANDHSKCERVRLIAEELIDTRKLFSWNSAPLSKNHHYRLTAWGVMSPNSGRWLYDWEYRYSDSLSSDCKSSEKMFAARIGFDSVALENDAKRINSNSITLNCIDHSYTYDLPGNDSSLHIIFRDGPLTDNEGELYFKLEEIINMPVDSILGYRSTETHQVVTYALRNKPELSYQWIATGGYLLGETSKHYCDVIWGYDKTGSVCCIVSDSTCTDTICVEVAINNATTGGIAGDVPTEPTMSARPNPTSDMIDISSVDATDATSYTLIDVTGRVLQQVHGKRVRMSVEDVPSGVYHLVMKNAEGTVVAMQRVVVQK